jgi:5-methylcytosine-specific restriction endonuclease McrA
MKQRKKTSVIWTTPQNELQKILDESSSVVEVLKKLGYDGYNGNHRTVTKRINSGEFDLTKFNENKKEELSSRTIRERLANKISNDQVFTENSTYHRTNLKLRLVKEMGFEYKCSDCGITDSYNGKPISLQLDHINGINNDNRLENLRFLCPNCHSQTGTFAGKSLNQKPTCACGQKLKSKKSKKCRKCANKDFKKSPSAYKEKIEWPEDEALQEMLWSEPAIKIGEKLKISSPAIKKRANQRGLSTPPRGYWNKIACGQTHEDALKVSPQKQPQQPLFSL